MKKDDILRESHAAYKSFAVDGGSFQLAIFKLLQLIIRILADKLGD